MECGIWFKYDKTVQCNDFKYKYAKYCPINLSAVRKTTKKFVPLACHPQRPWWTWDSSTQQIRLVRKTFYIPTPLSAASLSLSSRFRCTSPLITIGQLAFNSVLCKYCRCVWCLSFLHIRKTSDYKLNEFFPLNETKWGKIKGLHVSFRLIAFWSIFKLFFD